MGKKKEKKESRSLVKQAARDLGVEYHKGLTLGSLIKSEADQIVRQAAASTGIDPDDHKWRGITQSRRDLQPIEQDRLIDIANYLRRQNPLASRIADLRRDFVIGDGVTFEAEDDKRIQPLIDSFWNDSINNLDESQFDLVDYLGTNGELLLPVFINEFSGFVQLGWIDPVEIEQVIPDRHNRRIMREVWMKPGAGAGYSAYYDLSVKKKYLVAGVDTEPRSRSFNYRAGDLLLFRINCSPDSTRGRSDFESWADLVDAWDQANFNDLERVQLMLAFIWDVKLTGKTEPEIEKWLQGQNAPRPGSLRAHNENVEWKAEAPQLNLTETRTLANGIRKDVLGSAGLSEFFIGITEGANRASSENLDVPILKGLQSRQRKMRAVFREMIDFVIDQALLKNNVMRRAVESGRISREFKVKMPELNARDMTRIGAVLAQSAAAIDVAMERKWVKRETGAKIFAQFMNEFGIQYDPVEEMKGAMAEADEETTSDYDSNEGKAKLKNMKEVTGEDEEAA